MTRRQLLPVDGQHAVALQVAERAVVAEDVETIRGALERAAGLVAPVGAVADVGVHQRDAIVGGQAAHTVEQLRLGQVGVRITDRREHLVFAFGIPVEERDLGGGLGLVGGEDPGHEIGGVVAGLRESTRSRRRRGRGDRRA